MNLTPYLEINSLLDELLSDVQSILGPHFLGMYLHGSLALGDFTPHRSDIDFLVATHNDLPPGLVAELQAMHERISISDPRWGPELEGSYIPRRALRRYDPSDATYPHIERGGRLIVEHHDAALVIQGHILLKHGITLAGPPPHTLIDPVDRDELRSASAGIVREWWEPMIRKTDPRQLRHSGYQAYAVLTMCRILYTLHYGTIVSKPTAARWARQSEAKPWSALIDWALEWKGVVQEVEVEDAVELIRYTVERCREWERRT